jgi:carbon storage regulator
MLVLSRKVGQSVAIGGQLVKVKIVAVHGKSVRLAIDAPKEVTIHRDEIQRQIDGEVNDE